MATMYKLVTQEMTTRGGMKWEIGKTNKATGEGNVMCSDAVLHCYADPHLAVMFNPIHAAITNPRLLEIECSTVVNTDGLKHACKEQRPVKEWALPVLSKEQRVAFSIKCALLVFKQDWFVEWADGWLSGSDRSESAAWSAKCAAWRTKCAAGSAAWSAKCAAGSAESAAESAAKCAAGSAESAAKCAAESAAWSAKCAAWRTKCAAESAAAFKTIMQWVLTNIE